MNFRITVGTSDKKAINNQHSILVEAKSLSVGSGEDSLLRLKYSGIKSRHGQIQVNKQGKVTFTIFRGWTELPLKNKIIDLESVDQVALCPGVILRVGNKQLELHTIHLIVIIDHTLAQELKTPISLQELPISLKKISVLGVSLILLFGLCLPLLSHISPMRSYLHFDNFWLSGPLHPAHQANTSTCNSCHHHLFTPIADEACLECHRNTSNYAHVNGEKWHHQQEFSALKCISCHQEHNEPNNLINSNSLLCSQCHGDMALFKDSNSSNVTDFATHPQFKLTTVNWVDGEWHEIDELWREGLQERSNLKFSHADHLKSEGLSTLNGNKVLTCESCHKIDKSGQMFMPIEMETHCQSCHQLEYAPHDPVRKRSLPHGDPKLVIQMLQEFTAAKALELTKEELNQNGSSTRITAEKETDAATHLQPAIDKITQLLASELFERQLCATCHQVDVKPDLPLMERWQVTPVKLVNHWLQGAKFDHLKHRQSACIDCHKATTSERSADILVPGIENCRTCHADTSKSRMVASPCISCHNYHEKEHPLLESGREQ